MNPWGKHTTSLEQLSFFPSASCGKMLFFISLFSLSACWQRQHFNPRPFASTQCSPFLPLKAPQLPQLVTASSIIHGRLWVMFYSCTKGILLIYPSHTHFPACLIVWLLRNDVTPVLCDIKIWKTCSGYVSTDRNVSNRKTLLSMGKVWHRSVTLCQSKSYIALFILGSGLAEKLHQSFSMLSYCCETN